MPGGNDRLVLATERQLRRLERLVDIAGTLSLLLLFGLVSAQVVLRYVFGYTPFFIEELARYLMIWSALAGCALAVRSQSHIRVDFLVSLLPRSLALGWNFLIDLAVLALLALVAYQGVGTVFFLHAQTSTGMQLPLSYPNAAVPLFFGVATLFAAGHLLRRILR